MRLIYVLVVDTPIVSDFKMMYDASLELVNHTSNYKSLNYFLLWGYQMGHVVYQAFLLSIFNSVTFLEVMNSIITSLTVVFIYLICNISSSSISSKVVSILYLFFPFPLFMNSVLSNQQLPLLLILIALYLFLSIDYNKHIKKSLAIGIILGISNILRSEAIVIIFSLFLYSIFLLRRVHLKKIALSFFIIVIAYFSIFKGTSYILKVSDISPNGLGNMNPAWKFVIGFNYDTNGTYSSDDASIYSINYALSKQEAINRVSNIKRIPMLFLRKIKILWINSDISWSLGHISSSLFYRVFNIINQCFIFLFMTRPIRQLGV